MKLHVEPNGPAQTIDAGDGLQVTVSAPAMDNNVYWLRGADGPAVLIDAADDAARIREVVDHYDAVVTTHRHWDHIRALADLADGVTTYAGAPDVDAIAPRPACTANPSTMATPCPARAVRWRSSGSRATPPGRLPSRGSPPTAPPTSSPATHSSRVAPAGPASATLLEGRSMACPQPTTTVVHPGHGDAPPRRRASSLTEWRSRGW